MSEDQQRAVSETFEVRLSGVHGGVMLAETDAGEFTFSTSATRSSLNNNDHVDTASSGLCRRGKSSVLSIRRQRYARASAPPKGRNRRCRVYGQLGSLLPGVVV